MTVAEFTWERWHSVQLQREQAHDPRSLDTFLRLSSDGDAWSYLARDGHALMCGGLLPYEDLGAMAWSYIGADAGPHMLALVRESRKRLACAEERWPVMRAATLVEFKAGRRFLELLGFHDLAPLNIAGRPCRVYERKRQWTAKTQSDISPMPSRSSALSVKASSTSRQPTITPAF